MRQLSCFGYMISFTTLVLHLQSLLIYLPAIADLFKTSCLSAMVLNSNRDQKSQDLQLLKERFTPVLLICYDSVLKKIHGLDLCLSILLALWKTWGFLRRYLLHPSKWKKSILKLSTNKLSIKKITFWQVKGVLFLTDLLLSQGIMLTYCIF